MEFELQKLISALWCTKKPCFWNVELSLIGMAGLENKNEKCFLIGQTNGHTDE